MTKKELIEGGWIDKYVLGLTTEEESGEVERLAMLYPEVQDQINSARSRICGKFNRNLTQPALRHSLLTKRRILMGASLIVMVLLVGFALLWKEHFLLKTDYHIQSEQLAEEEAKVDQMASLSRQVSERSHFLNSATTQRIKVKGCESSPDAEVLVFQNTITGKMMLQVVDLPGIPDGHHYEVWAQHPYHTDRKIGHLVPPLRYDSLYILDTVLHYSSLQISTVDPVLNVAEPVCIATVNK